MIPYREQKYICGSDYMDIAVFPVFEYKSKSSRRKKRKPSSEVRQMLNEKNAQRKLSRLAKTNFGTNDYSGTPTYLDSTRPESVEQARKDWQNFIRRVRKVYKKHNAELRYIWTIEQSEKGNIHFHVLLSGGVPREEIEDAWGLGLFSLSRLKLDKDGADRLVNYICKSKRVLYRRWSGSKNLKKPTERKNDSFITFGRAKKLYKAACAGDIDGFKQLYQWDKRLPEYDIAAIEPLHNEFNGDYYLFLRLYKPSALVWRPKRNVRNREKGKSIRRE